MKRRSLTCRISLASGVSSARGRYLLRMGSPKCAGNPRGSGTKSSRLVDRAAEPGPAACARSDRAEEPGPPHRHCKMETAKFQQEFKSANRITVEQSGYDIYVPDIMPKQHARSTSVGGAPFLFSLQPVHLAGKGGAP
eukprot:2918944-Amphidinium_carterae.1